MRITVVGVLIIVGTIVVLVLAVDVLASNTNQKRGTNNSDQPSPNS